MVYIFFLNFRTNIWFIAQIRGLNETVEPFLTGAHLLRLISIWMNNYIHYYVCGEITVPFLNFNSATAEV